MSRTDKAVKNLFFAIGGQIIGLIISFISRSVFICVLGTEYLGVNGLFTNILTVISFAELGVGAAITFCLYEPLAKGDEEKIKSLMHLYKTAYKWIGIVVLLVGLALTPFIHVLVKSDSYIANLKIIFFLFVLNSAMSYFYSYKRSLIIANQNKYITTVYRYVFYFILNITQMFFLVLTHNYILFLILQVIFTLAENICVSKRADKLYPFLKETDIQPLDKKTKIVIVRNVKAMLFHKTGSIFVGASDNIIISKILGVANVGLYSNYSLITQALHMVFSAFFQSATAGVGNLGATEERQHQLTVFYRLFFMNFIIYGFSSIAFINMINPFISLWLGNEFVLGKSIVIVLGINFYITGMRKSVLTFREALGLYWYDRYKPLAESLINLVISIVLAYKFGLVGVFAGTIVSSVTVCCWIEPLVLYKYGFKTSSRQYFLRLLLYTSLLVVVELIVNHLCSLFVLSSILTLILNALISLLVSVLVVSLFFAKSDEFTYILKLCKKALLGKK